MSQVMLLLAMRGAPCIRDPKQGFGQGLIDPGAIPPLGPSSDRGWDHPSDGGRMSKHEARSLPASTTVQ